MSQVAPTPATIPTPPRVARRATLGVGIVLLVLHGLAGGTPDATERSSALREQARLRLDPSAATREELMLLPRVGPAIADYIIEHRESVRPALAFRWAEDLKRVHRIGPATVERLRPYLRFPPARITDHAEVGLP